MTPYRFSLPLLAALLLSACGGEDASQQGAQRPDPGTSQPAAPARNLPAVTGRVSAGDLTQLPTGIALRLRLLDVTDPATPPVTVAERSAPDTRRLPADFALPYDPARIAPERRYVVQAELVTEGVTLYSTPDPQPVLTQGAAARADLVLTRGSGPDTSISVSEQYRRDFDLLESQLGNLRRAVGERVTDDVTVGWDAFVDATGVRFARESVDFAQGGRASFRYAFRNGLPWVLVRERGRTTTYLGWNPEGELVLNQHGESGSVDASEAARLYARAAEMFEIASARSSRAR